MRSQLTYSKTSEQECWCTIWLMVPPGELLAYRTFSAYISKYKQQAGRDLKGGAASRIFWQFQEYWFLSKTSKTHAFLQQVLNPCLFPSNSNLWQNRLSQLLALQLSKWLPGMTNTLRGCMEGWKYHGHDRDWVGKPTKQTVAQLHACTGIPGSVSSSGLGHRHQKWGPASGRGPWEAGWWLSLRWSD